MGKKATTRAAQRYRLLIDQLREEYPGIGQKELADKLGVQQPLISKVMAGGAGVGVEALEAAMKRLRIHSAYFFATFPTEPRYKDHLRTRILPAPREGYGAMKEFLRLIEATGDVLSDQERHALESQEWPGEPTIQTYVMFLQCLRTLKPSDTAVRKARKAS